MAEALPGMEDEFTVPATVQESAERYVKALSAANKALEEKTVSKLALIDAMLDSDIETARVLLKSGVERIIRHTTSDGICIEKPRKQDHAEPEEIDLD